MSTLIPGMVLSSLRIFLDGLHSGMWTAKALSPAAPAFILEARSYLNGKISSSEATLLILILILTSLGLQKMRGYFPQSPSKDYSSRAVYLGPPILLKTPPEDGASTTKIMTGAQFYARKAWHPFPFQVQLYAFKWAGC